MVRLFVRTNHTHRADEGRNLFLIVQELSKRNQGLISMKIAFIIFLTGISFNCYSQKTDTISHYSDTVLVKSKPPSTFHKTVPYLAPTALVVYGILSLESDLLQAVDGNVSADLRKAYPHFRTRIDDKLQFMPAVSAYALGFIGVKGKNTFSDKTALYFISNAIMGVSVYGLKIQTHKLRPDGSDNLAFPSGHTASAFVAAEFMTQEYKDVSPWYGIAAYTMAAATGSLRMLNNKHWLSDVVMGAGVGILSTKLAYVVYPVIKRSLGKTQTSKVMIMPSYQPGMFGFSMAVRLNKKAE